MFATSPTGRKKYNTFLITEFGFDASHSNMVNKFSLAVNFKSCATDSTLGCWLNRNHMLNRFIEIAVLPDYHALLVIIQSV